MEEATVPALTPANEGGLPRDEEEEAGIEDEEAEEEEGNEEGNEEEVRTDDADDAEAAANAEDIEFVESDENEAVHPTVEGDSEATRPIDSPSAQSTSSNNTGAESSQSLKARSGVKRPAPSIHPTEVSDP